MTIRFFYASFFCGFGDTGPISLDVCFLFLGTRWKIAVSSHSNLVTLSLLFSTDQTRGKATRPGVRAAAPGGKKAAPPDVVSASLRQSEEAAAAEVARLEALCETRTKQLRTTRLQLRAGLGAFDAMATLVRYLTEQVSEFSESGLRGGKTFVCSAGVWYHR